MITLSIRGLPRSTTEDSLGNLFNEHGRIHGLKLSKDLFSGECRGFAEVQMEGHEARAAIDALDGRTVDGAAISVRQQVKRAKRGGRR